MNEKAYRVYGKLLFSGRDLSDFCFNRKPLLLSSGSPVIIRLFAVAILFFDAVAAGVACAPNIADTATGNITIRG